MKWWKKMANKVLNPEKDKKLMYWQGKYETAKNKYENNLKVMEKWEKHYSGDRHVNSNPNEYEGEAGKLSINVRNIDYELIESQVDSSIPMPKVIPVHKEDLQLARVLEEFLKSVVKTKHLSIINDIQERTTPIQGGSFTLLEWDNTISTHCTVGDIKITDVHPRRVIPQPGIVDMGELDYIFVRTPQTKTYIKNRFGKDVSDEKETDKDIRNGEENEDILTVVTVYYRNEEGGMGLYRFCGDVMLEDIDDYQARHLTVCKECGATKTEDVCPICGSKKFEERKDDIEEIALYNQVQAGTSLDGTPIMVSEQIIVKIPFYKPNVLPIVLRKNISRDRSFLGFSDIEAIQDQQDTIKKLGSKINEKVLKGGSYVTLPRDVGIETTDEEFKVIRIDNPQQKALIDVITVQADTSQDRVLLETNYQWAKSTLGITDAFQGKYDASATSGAAKQYSINQAAGRLESKRNMKNNAYSQIYEMIFKFALAYADQPIPIAMEGTDGEVEFSHFDKTMFLKQDSAGEWYWNDEFIFDIDPTSTLLTNREAMWNQADLKLQSGAFGPLGDLETNYLYWLEQERNGYPNAGEIKKVIEQRLQQQKEQAAMAQQMQAMQGQQLPM